MRLLYYSPSSYGGLADYAHEQVIALTSQGVEVILLCTPDYLKTRDPIYQTIPILREHMTAQTAPNKIVKAADFVGSILVNFATLATTIKIGGFNRVLLGSYVEYMAPLWAKSLKQLSNHGIKFGAIVHDPVRDFVLGPLWWHRRSVASGYSFLSEAFVHEATELDTVKPMPHLHTTVIPHGSYKCAEPSESVAETRSRLNLPVSASVMLAFGHIRANKNLDLVIRAMAQVPNVYLVVAGKELRSHQNLTAQYQQLAQEMGVSDRCRWEIRFISEQDVANLFQAADLALLTYNHTFRSASGVLNTAAGYRTPCLASSGIGPLQSIVKDYRLGNWVEPDNLDAIISGLKTWLSHPSNPEWSRFFQDNSWQRNAEIVISRLLLS